MELASVSKADKNVMEVFQKAHNVAPLLCERGRWNPENKINTGFTVRAGIS